MDWCERERSREVNAGVKVMVVNTGLFFQAEDGIRELVRSRGLGDVYKRQLPGCGTGDNRRIVSRATVRSSRMVADCPSNQSASVSYTHLTLPTIYSV